MANHCRYLYNDANYIAEKLADFAAAWKERKDISARAQNMLRLDNDVKIMQGFATRAYSSEMNTQKLVLRDLLGGNFRHESDHTEFVLTQCHRRAKPLATG